MTRRTLIPATHLALGLLLLLPACDKNKQQTEAPDQVAADTGASSEGALETEGDNEGEVASLPPQDPDPPAIADLYSRYLLGDYETVAQEAGDLAATMTADTQVRARALASAIHALAAIEGVPESGEAPAETAVSEGERLDDPEVRQLAHIARAAYRIGILDAVAGQAEVKEALALEGPYENLGLLVLGEAYLNQAFGTGEDDTRIVNPGSLDDAEDAYKAAIAAGPDIVAAHAHEGLAAVAKFKRDKPAICEHAQQAENLYASSGATNYVREVPSLLAKDGRCSDFKKAP